MHRLTFPWHDRASLILWISGWIINAATWTGLIIGVARDQSLVPLHYTIYFGIDLTGNWMQILILPLVGTIIALTHSVLAGWQPGQVWQRTWLTLNVVLQILLAGSAVTLVYVSRLQL